MNKNICLKFLKKILLKISIISDEEDNKVYVEKIDKARELIEKLQNKAQVEKVC